MSAFNAPRSVAQVVCNKRRCYAGEKWNNDNHAGAEWSIKFICCYKTQITW